LAFPATQSCVFVSSGNETTTTMSDSTLLIVGIIAAIWAAISISIVIWLFVKLKKQQ